MFNLSAPCEDHQIDRMEDTRTSTFGVFAVLEKANGGRFSVRNLGFPDFHSDGGLGCSHPIDTMPPMRTSNTQSHLLPVEYLAKQCQFFSRCAPSCEIFLRLSRRRHTDTSVRGRLWQIFCISKINLLTRVELNFIAKSIDATSDTSH